MKNKPTSISLADCSVTNISVVDCRKKTKTKTKKQKTKKKFAKDINKAL